MYIGVAGITLDIEDVNDCARLVAALYNAGGGESWRKVDSGRELERWGLCSTGRYVVTTEAYAAGGAVGCSGAGVNPVCGDGKGVEVCRDRSRSVSRDSSRDVVGVGEGTGEGVFPGVADGCVGAVGSVPVVVGSASVRSKKRGKNQRDREKRGKGVVLPSRGVAGGSWRKEVSSVSDSVPVVVSEPLVPVVEDKSDARKTLERKWVVENEVAIAKAELAKVKAMKDIEFQRARDVEAEIKRARTLVVKQTESNKVATEKAFATLRATGNVPGFCETVVSDGGSVPGLSGGSSAEGCTISPDSSASMHEFREAQKKVLDLEDKIRRMERAERMRATVGEIAITNDGDEPSPSLQEEMDRQDEKYNTQYVYEPAAIGGKNVLLLRCETFGDYCEGEDY